MSSESIIGGCPLPFPRIFHEILRYMEVLCIVLLTGYIVYEGLSLEN